jgi:hypothetical protein
MSRLHGPNVSNTTVEDHQHEDGYVLVGRDGYTVLNTLNADSVFKSFARTGVGLWTATMSEAYPCNLNYFKVLPQLHVGDSPPVVFFQLLNDNVGTLGTIYPQQRITFKFCNGSGTAEDLPANAGFKYKVGFSLASVYYTRSY